MSTQSVQTLVEDIRFVSEANHEMVDAVRALVKKTFKPFAGPRARARGVDI